MCVNHCGLPDVSREPSPGAPASHLAIRVRSNQARHLAEALATDENVQRRYNSYGHGMKSLLTLRLPSGNQVI